MNFLRKIKKSTLKTYVTKIVAFAFLFHPQFKFTNWIYFFDCFLWTLTIKTIDCNKILRKNLNDERTKILSFFLSIFQCLKHQSKCFHFCGSKKKSVFHFLVASVKLAKQKYHCFTKNYRNSILVLYTWKKKIKASLQNFSSSMDCFKRTSGGCCTARCTVPYCTPPSFWIAHPTARISSRQPTIKSRSLPR